MYLKGVSTLVSIRACLWSSGQWWDVTFHLKRDLRWLLRERISAL